MACQSGRERHGVAGSCSPERPWRDRRGFIANVRHRFHLRHGEHDVRHEGREVGALGRAPYALNRPALARNGGQRLMQARARGGEQGRWRMLLAESKGSGAAVLGVGPNEDPYSTSTLSNSQITINSRVVYDHTESENVHCS